MAPESEHLYLELLNRIVEVQRDLYGDLAVKVAAKVKKLELSAEGKVVKIDGPADAAIRDLVWEYESLGGGTLEVLRLLRARRVSQGLSRLAIA